MTITLSNSQPTAVGPGSLFIGVSGLQVAGHGYLMEITVADVAHGRLAIAGRSQVLGVGNMGVILGIDEGGTFIQPGNITLPDAEAVTVTVTIYDLPGGTVLDSLVLPTLAWSPAGDLGRIMQQLAAQMSNEFSTLLGLLLGGSVGGKLDSILAAVTFTAY